MMVLAMTRVVVAEVLRLGVYCEARTDDNYSQAGFKLGEKGDQQ